MEWRCHAGGGLGRPGTWRYSSTATGGGRYVGQGIRRPPRGAGATRENAAVLGMAIEIEIKLRVPSHDPVRQALDARGAQCHGTAIETNYILDLPDGSLRASGHGLRVRRIDRDGKTTATLTVKGPSQGGSMKTREEREVAVGDAIGAVEMLRLLGYAPILQYEKRRESWSLDDCLIELDTPPRVGLFVEIEGPSEKAVRSVQEKLGLGGQQHVQRPYRVMMWAYCRVIGIPDFLLTRCTVSAAQLRSRGVPHNRSPFGGLRKIWFLSVSAEREV